MATGDGSGYTLSDFDLGWAVGMIEGEGHISATKRKDRARGWRVTIGVSSNDRTILTRLQGLFGGGIYRHSTNNSLANEPGYAWQISAIREVQTILQLVYPHLSDRRKAQADRALAVRPIYGPGGIGRGNG
ncbi:MAG: hypothetical protein ACRDPC_24270 [Solirubrobacteraceae bacterium]